MTQTAMQQLVEHIQINATKFSLMNTYNILKEIEPYLEKEKEQIKILTDALERIKDWDDEMHSEWDDQGEFASFTLKTYNQNK